MDAGSQPSGLLDGAVPRVAQPTNGELLTTMVTNLRLGARN